MVTKSSFDWTDKCVLVTGGAGFIGSHLVELLVDAGARVTVLDNLTSGSTRQSRRRRRCRHIVGARCPQC